MVGFEHPHVSGVRWRWTEYNGEAIPQALVITAIQNPNPDASMGFSKKEADEIVKAARGYLKSGNRPNLIIEVI